MWNSMVVLSAAAVLVVMLVLPQVSLAQSVWMERVGLPLDGYTGKGVLVVVVSTGINPRHPVLESHVLRVDGVPCAVAFDEQGRMYVPTGISATSIGTQEALEVVSAAPGVKLAFVEVPYTRGSNGVPQIPPPALRAALEWLLDPVVVVGNETLRCDFSRFTSVIVLLGLPDYQNYTLPESLSKLLDVLASRYLIVTPVGDVAPGVLNTLAKKIGVISVTWLPVAGPVLPNGHSGGFWLEEPSGEYRDLPLAPSYSMPVETDSCAVGYTVDAVTCSEIAAARFAGLAAVLAETYLDLTGAPPLPYELEHLIRASVRDEGAPYKDTLYGWGLPDARVAYSLLASNSGFRICAPSYTRGTFALVGLEAPNAARYALILYPGECVEARALPSVPYRIHVYGPLTLDPGYTVATTVAGYYRKIVVMPALSASTSVTGRIVDEKGVALDGEILVLPPDLSLVDAVTLNIILHPLRFEHGNINVALSWKYLHHLGDQAYLMIKPDGHLARIYPLPVDKPATINLETQVFVPTLNVYLLGRGAGAEEDAFILRLLGFNVTLGAEPVPPPEASVIVVHPSMAWDAWQAQAAGRGVVLMGHALVIAKRGLSYTITEPQAIAIATPVYKPEYQPLLRASNLLLARLYGYSNTPGGGYTVVAYNATLVPGEKPLVEMYSYVSGVAGRIVEVAFDPRVRTAFVANLWSYWGDRIGSFFVSPRSLLASATPGALAALQLAVAAAAHPIWVQVDKSVVHVNETLSISTWGWKLQATIWAETVHGLSVVSSVEARYPGYQANATLTIPLEPYGEYVILVNDSLWGLALASYKVVPFLIARPSAVTAGGYLELVGTGYPANAVLQVLLDGVSIYSTVSGPLGNFTCMIRVPSVAEPGTHHISVVYDGIGASAVITVSVSRVLDVKVSLPSIVTPNMSVEGRIVVLLGWERVDANVTVYVAGSIIRPVRLGRGLYAFVIPPLPPGSYTVTVIADYSSRLVRAHGEAVGSFSVVPVPSEGKILEALSWILGRYHILYNESVARLREDVEKTEAVLANITSGIESLNETLHSVAEKLLGVASSLSQKISVSSSQISRRLDALSDRLSKLESSIAGLRDTLASLVEERVRKALVGVENRISSLSVQVNRGFSSVNARLDNLAQLITTRGPLTGMNYYIALGLILANVALTAAVLVSVKRR